MVSSCAVPLRWLLRSLTSTPPRPDDNPTDTTYPAPMSHSSSRAVSCRLDVSGPVAGPWRLHQHWPASRLVVIEDEGRGGPQMTATWRAALDEIHSQLTRT